MDVQCYCGCERIPARREMKDSRIVYGLWCKNGCGSWLAVKQSKFDLSERFAMYDEGRTRILQQARQEERRIASEKNLHQWNLEKEKQRRKWHDMYGAFRGTAAWKNMSERVIERDGGICQCCLKKPAEEVHHLKYPGDPELFANQPLFEMVAVCRECHKKRIHPEKQ